MGVLQGPTVPSLSNNSLSKHADGMGWFENGPYTVMVQTMGDFQNAINKMHTI